MMRWLPRWLLIVGILPPPFAGLPGTAPVNAHLNSPPGLRLTEAPTPTQTGLVPDWYFEGDESGDEVGYAVAAAGDVNGDNSPDILVGAPKDDLDLEAEGVAYAFWGSPGGLPSLPDWKYGSGLKGSEFGAALGSAGDVNGDGYDDVVIGAYRYKNDQATAGAVFLFYGSSSGLSPAPDWSYVSSQKDADLGISVGTAGDLNWDGYSDIVVGARGYSDGQLNEGAVLVFLGSLGGLSDSPDWIWESDQVGAGLGTSVATASDVNGDGYSDLIAGAPYFDQANANEGAAFVFYGSPSGPASSPDWTAYGNQEGATFGRSVATARDVNDDGYGDVVIGAPLADGDLVDEGLALVFAGSAYGLSPTPNWQVSSGQVGSGFGISVTGSGDVNDDGYDDVAVGANLYTGDQKAEGAAFLYFGSPVGLSTTPGWGSWGDKADTGFGTSTAGADANRDGVADLLVGAPLYRQDRDLVGRSLCYYGPLTGYTPPLSYVYLPLVLLATGH